MKFIKTKIILFVIVFFGSCYYDKEDLLYPQLTSQCDTSHVTFKTTVQPLISSYCTGCHGNTTFASYGNNIKLEDYIDLKSNIDRVYNSISYKNGYAPMPKNGNKLMDCLINEIKIWKDNGALNN